MNIAEKRLPRCCLRREWRASKQEGIPRGGQDGEIHSGAPLSFPPSLPSFVDYLACSVDGEKHARLVTCFRCGRHSLGSPVHQRCCDGGVCAKQGRCQRPCSKLCPAQLRQGPSPFLEPVFFCSSSHNSAYPGLRGTSQQGSDISIFPVNSSHFQHF